MEKSSCRRPHQLDFVVQTLGIKTPLLTTPTRFNPQFCEGWASFCELAAWQLVPSTARKRGALLSARRHWVHSLLHAGQPAHSRGVTVPTAIGRQHRRHLVCPTAPKRGLDGAGYCFAHAVTCLYQEHDIHQISAACVGAIGPRRRVSVNLLGELLGLGDGQHFSRGDAGKGQKIFTL